MDEPTSVATSIENQNSCRQQQQRQQQQQQQQFASAPACLAPTLQGKGAPESPPLSAVADKMGSRSVSDRRARVGGGSSPLVSNGRGGKPLLSPSCSSMAMGRRASSGGRRMPGMVRKSLQVRGFEFYQYCCVLLRAFRWYGSLSSFCFCAPGFAPVVNFAVVFYRCRKRYKYTKSFFWGEIHWLCVMTALSVHSSFFCFCVLIRRLHTIV